MSDIGGSAVSRQVGIFVIDQDKDWRSRQAADSSESLKRCLNRLREIVGSSWQRNEK
jgi:hypothetical protein